MLAFREECATAQTPSTESEQAGMMESRIGIREARNQEVISQRALNTALREAAGW